MILSDIRSDVRSLTDETIANSQLTNIEIDRFINKRLDYVYSKIIAKNQSFFGTTDSTIDLVASQEAYALPDLDSNNQTRVEHILHMKIAYDGSDFRRITPIDYIEIVDNNFQNSVYTQNDPVYYLLGNNIHILPNPTANATNALKIWYLQRPAQLTEDTHVPAFSPLYHWFIPYGAAADVKRKEHSFTGDSSDLAAARDFKQQFDEGLTELLETIEPRESVFPQTVKSIDDIDSYPQELYVPPSSITL